MANERTMTSAVATAIQAGTVRPVLIGRFDIVSDPLTAWTGPGIFLPVGSGDSALDGQTFSPLAPILSMTDIIEDQAMGGPATLAISANDLDEDLLRQVVRDKRLWRGQPAYLWVGFLDSTEASVIADPVRIKTGVITNMVTNRGPENAIVSLTIGNDLGNSRSAPYRWLDHARIFSADTWSTFIIKLANQQQGFITSGRPFDVESRESFFGDNRDKERN